MEPRSGVNPNVIRTLFIIEPMAEMLRAPGFPLVEAKVQLRARHAEAFAFTGLGDDSVELLYLVNRREIDLATMNPSGLLTAAYRGKGPFSAPMDIRIVTVIPSLDWLGFFVAERTGLRSLADVKERHYPLKVSLRGSPTNVTQLYAHQVLAAYGFSFDDILAWGGSVIREDLMAFHPARYGKVKTGEIDAIVDEGIRQLIPLLDDLEMRMLPIDEPVLQRMDEIGFHRATLPRALFPNLPSDVPTLCFSGFPVYTHARRCRRRPDLQLLQGPRRSPHHHPIRSHRAAPAGRYVSRYSIRPVADTATRSGRALLARGWLPEVSGRVPLSWRLDAPDSG